MLERRDLAHRDLRKISHKMSKFQPKRILKVEKNQGPNLGKNDDFDQFSAKKTRFQPIWQFWSIFQPTPIWLKF